MMVVLYKLICICLFKFYNQKLLYDSDDTNEYMLFINDTNTIYEYMLFIKDTNTIRYIFIAVTT